MPTWQCEKGRIRRKGEMQGGRRAWQLEKRCFVKLKISELFFNRFVTVFCIELVVIRTPKG